MHNVLTAPRGGLLTIGAILALYFSSGAIEALRIGLNRAYDMTETRPWWLLRLESVAYVLIGAVSLLALAFLVVLWPLIWAAMLRFAPGLEPLEGTVSWVRLGIASLLMAISLLIAHHWLPSGRRTFVDIIPGVLLTYVSCLVFGEIFGAYLGEFARNYVSTYAGLASVMIALVFLYSWRRFSCSAANSMRRSCARARRRAPDRASACALRRSARHIPIAPLRCRSGRRPSPPWPIRRAACTRTRNLRG